MKLCMMSYSLWRQPKTFSVRGMFELTRELQLEGIDFVTLNDTDPRELRKMAADIGVEVACHTFFADVNHAEADKRRAGVAEILRGIDNALLLGTKRSMLVTPGKDAYTPQESRRHYLDTLAQAAHHARAAGVTLTVENFPGADSPFVTSGDVLQLVHDIPGMRITFDSGNCLTGGEPPDLSYKRSAGYVVHAHFKDWDIVTEGGRLGGDGRRYKGALIGEGIIDHRTVLSVMHHTGYDGFINIEYEGDKPAADAVRKATHYLRDLIAQVKSA